MKQLFLWSLKRQEADNCIRFNTKNYSGTEKRRQMTLPGERLHISRQKVPRSWIRTAAGNADSGTCRFHSGCYSGEGQHLSEIPGKYPLMSSVNCKPTCACAVSAPASSGGAQWESIAVVGRLERASALVSRAQPNPKHQVLCLEWVEFTFLRTSGESEWCCPEGYTSGQP